MRKINRTDVIKIMLVLTLVAGTGLALGSVGRFTPSHMITEEVYCGSCHPEQVQELNATTHLADFKSGIEEGVGYSNISAALATTGACTMCHNFWDNMKWFGVTNLTINRTQVDNPAPIEDIYGNVVSPYGLSSTYGYQVNITGVVPWGQGLDTYSYKDGKGHDVKRVDFMWSALSAISPGPAAFYTTESDVHDANLSTPKSCGTAEKGLCHVAQQAVIISFNGQRPEMLNATPPQEGSGVFFRHEMAFTTAQYAAKPVKICGACHVFKLPPMTWGGEPWSQGVIEAASKNGGVAQEIGGQGATTALGISGPNNNPNDPFGFVPTYDMTGFVDLTNTNNSGTTIYNEITYKTPDWAHANVPCIRCHVHAGINGVTVSDNNPTTSNPGTPWGKSAPTYI